MDIVTSVAQTLFAALQNQQLRDILTLLNYQSDLEKLQNTVETVQKVLLYASTKRDEELTPQDLHYIDELKDVIYDADDLLDEFVTKAERKHNKLFKEGRATNIPDHKVYCFFSRIKDLPFAYKMSQGVKEVRKKLDAIADNHNKFDFKLDSQIIRERREETCSYVYEQGVIGRDDDKQKIISMLLDPNAKSDVSFLTIFGIGGMGKTTLAQLVYNDPRIDEEFPAAKFWVCVGDEDTKKLNVQAVLAKFLGSIYGNKNDQASLQFLQDKVRARLSEKKYLLILDDIWNENRSEWLKLEDLLKGVPSGSWVVVTTRSSTTASIIGDGSSYKLEGLSDEASLSLFERTAFKQEEAVGNSPHLVEIGKKIVKKCANVPLAIKVVGTLLYGQDENEWSSFEKNPAFGVGGKKDDVLSVLKLSYYSLDPPLKSCFGYCALFPKDYRIEKEKLLFLWRAQGYIKPFKKDQSIEDASEDYFLILLRRCFFQDVERDEYGAISSFKLHDLMHEVAQEVSKTEVCIVSDTLNKKSRHLFVDEDVEAIGSWAHNKVRTLLFNWWLKENFLVRRLENWMSLRALDLSHSKIVTLPNMIGKLVHLRYLDLSGNSEMKELPKSFTKLHNLETLLLNSCHELVALPDDFWKLVKLMCLDMEGCWWITHMPIGMGKLSYLYKLPLFAVDLSNRGCLEVLKVFRHLANIKGHLHIKTSWSKNVVYKKGDNIRDAKYLMNKHHLTGIHFQFQSLLDGEASDWNEALMESMQPHSNLKKLSLYAYMGKKLPRWAREDKLTTLLPNLVSIGIENCYKLENLPSLGKLTKLRDLYIGGLEELEYMEENRNSRKNVQRSSFFPSLR